MRASPIYYIEPSAISITPNCNGSANDLAIYVAPNSRIKVYSKKSGIDTANASFQEWTFSGRNRRLSQSDVEYTIYARLPKNDKAGGYLVFAPKWQYEEEWVDKYPYVKEGGIEYPRAYTLPGDNWYIRIGDVSLPKDGKRTVTFDTGILGTDLYNTEWNLNSDNLPFRIDLSCKIGDVDAGQTPYVKWGELITIDALLIKGWETDAASQVGYWTISRNTGNADSDNEWNHPDGTNSFRRMADGHVSLTHSRDTDDDFNGAVAATYTISAYSLEGEIIGSNTITILAETVSIYELEVSSDTVSYNRDKKSYAPSEDISIRIRSKSQDGDVSYINQARIETEQLRVYCLSKETNEGNVGELAFSEGKAFLPVATVKEGKGVILQLKNRDNNILSQITISYVYIEGGLSTEEDDVARGVITFLKGVLFGQSGAWGWVRESWTRTVAGVEETLAGGVAWFKTLLADALDVAGRAKAAIVEVTDYLTGGAGGLVIKGNVGIQADAESGQAGDLSVAGGTTLHDTTIGGDVSAVGDVRAGGDATIGGDLGVSGDTSLADVEAKSVTAETLTVTKSAHFFELVIDKVKAAGGSLILSPADGFKVDRVVEQEVKATDAITYGNGIGCANKMENYIVLNNRNVYVYEGDVGQDAMSCNFAKGVEATFEYEATADGIVLMYKHAQDYTTFTMEVKRVTREDWESITYTQGTVSSRTITSAGAYTTAANTYYRVYQYPAKKGDKFRITGVTSAAKTTRFVTFAGKYSISGTWKNNIMYEAVVNNHNLNHLSSTSSTNQRRKLDYRTGELWSAVYGNANTYYVSPYIDVADVDTITFRLPSVGSNGAALCAYDEDFNYIQENSVATTTAATTWTKGENTRWVRFSSVWTYSKDSYYIRLNGNTEEKQTVRWLSMGYCEFQNVESVKVYADLQNLMFKNADVLIADYVACVDWNGRGGLYDKISGEVQWGVNDSFKAGESGDLLKRLGTALEWRSTDGERRIANMWRAGDQALCQTFNAAEGTAYGVSNKYYWALVSEVGTETGADGEDYHFIRLDEEVVDGTLTPEPGDEVAMLGYRGTDDPERQGAVYMAAYNSIDTSAKAPMIGIYAGIDDFHLASHRVALVSPTAVRFLSSLFRMETDGGGEAGQLNMRGAWTEGMTCGRWDAVSYGGELWLCVLPAGATTQQAPGADVTETVGGAPVAAWELLVEKGADGLPGDKGDPGQNGSDGEKGEKGDTGAAGEDAVVLTLDNDADAVQLRSTGGEYAWSALAAWTGSANTRTLTADGLYTTGSSTSYRVYWLKMGRGDTLRFTGTTNASRIYRVGYSEGVPVLDETVLTHLATHSFASGVGKTVEWTAPADGYAVVYRYYQNWTSAGHTVGRLSADTELVGAWPSTTARVLEGAAQVAAATTAAAGADAAKVVWSKADTGCASTGALDVETGAYTVTLTAISAEKATVAVRAAYKGLTLEKVFTVLRLLDEDKYELRLSRESVVRDPATGVYDVTEVAAPEVWVSRLDGTSGQAADMYDRVEWATSAGLRGVFDAAGTALPVTVLEGATWVRFWLMPAGTLDGGAIADADAVPWLDREEMAVVSNGAQGDTGADAVVLGLEPPLATVTETYSITPEGTNGSTESLVTTGWDTADGDVLARATVTVRGITTPATAQATDSPEFTTTSGAAVKLSNRATLLQLIGNSGKPQVTVGVTVLAVVDGVTHTRVVPLTIYVNRLGKMVSETIGDVTATLRTRNYVGQSGMESYVATEIQTAEGTIQQWAHGTFDQYGNDIADLNTRVSTAEGNIDTVSHRVDGVETDVSHVSQKADAIESTVSSLKIGGRNLLLNSDFAEVSSGTPQYFYYGRTAFSTRTAITTSLPPGFKTGLQLVATATTCVLSMSPKSSNQRYMQLTRGAKFLLSFWVRTSASGVTIAVTYNSEGGWTESSSVRIYTQKTAAANTWERMVFPIEGQYFNPDALHIGPQQACTMSLTGLQLEEGTIPTDWRRAEDDLTKWESSIRQLADRIDLTVTQDDVEQCGIHLDGQQGKVTLTGRQTVIDGDLDVRGLFTNAVREIRWDEDFSDGYEWPAGATARQYVWSGFVHDNGTMIVPIDLSEVKSVKTRGISGAMSVNTPSYNTHPIVILPAYDEERIEGMSAYPVALVRQSGVRITVTNSIHLRYRHWRTLNATGSSTPLGLALWNAATLLCADPRLLRYASYQSGSGMPTPTATVTATGTNPSIKSCFVANGEYAKFLALPPGQSVTLVSAVEYLGDTASAVPYLVWYVENAADFACVRALMTIRTVSADGATSAEKDYLFTDTDHYSSLGILAPQGMNIPSATVGDSSTRSLLIELQQGQWPNRIGEHDTSVT